MEGDRSAERGKIGGKEKARKIGEKRGKGGGGKIEMGEGEKE